MPGETLKQCMRAALDEAILHRESLQRLLQDTSSTSVKPLSHECAYYDCGNWSGSCLIKVLVFPDEYHLETNESLMQIVNPTGDATKRDVLAFWGQLYQTSGKGPHNYRTNILDAMLSKLGPVQGADSNARG